MGSDDVGVEGGVPWVTVPWAALNFNAVPDSNVLDMGSGNPTSGIARQHGVLQDSTDMDDDGTSRRASGIHDLEFDGGRARDRGNFGQRSGGDVMMNDLSTDKTSQTWVTIPWQAGSKKFHRQLVDPSHPTSGLATTNTLPSAVDSPSTKPKKKRKREPGHAARNYARDPATRLAQQKDPDT